jgi:DNA-binding CsgD family transcriptional regulator
VREAERRGRARCGSAGLLDRDSALGAIARVLDAAQEQVGAVLLLEGHAGLGKTRLYEIALDQARARGLRVLSAACAELERDLAFGVAQRLIGGLLRDLPANERGSLLTRTSQRVRELVGIGRETLQPGGGGDLALAHGLFAVLASAAETRGALIAIDDLQWCDESSLEFVLYLLHRLGELPVAVLLTSRPVVGDEATGVLDRVAAHPRVRIEPLAPLGAGAVGKLARQALGARADPKVAAACRAASSGNPFYLHELLLALRDERELSGDELARRVGTLAPDAVTRSVRVRVGRLGGPAAALARAVAILGDDVPVRDAAVLAGITIDQASIAADRLAAVEVLLAREPLGFVHPLVRGAIEQDIPVFERSSRHLDAALLLHRDGGEPERVAAHLLLGRAAGEDWVVEQLRAAARQARERGAERSAVRYLERALAEPPGAERRGEVLAELGAAEAAAGIPAAAEHLAAAAAQSPEPRRRAELGLARGQALYAHGLHEQAAAAYDQGLMELPTEHGDRDALELRDELETGFIATASLVPSLQARARERSAALLNNAAEMPRTHGRRMLLAQAAVQSSLAGEPAHRCVELATWAWDEGQLLERETADGVAWSLVTAALTWSGELERSIEVADAVLQDAQRRSSPLAFATASYCRSVPRLWQARVNDALADLELARDAQRYGWRQFNRAAAAIYTLCLIETGDLERAEQSLTAEGPLDRPRDIEDALRLFARAELRLAQGRAREALDDALASQRSLGPTITYLAFVPWHSTAAQAALTLGDHDRALELAREELNLAEQTGVLIARIRALRVLGLCEQRERTLELLRWAAELGSQAPARLETVRALIDLGAALRRANQRAAAREPLQQAADAAQRGGATVLYERARTELTATGARPRRDALLSGVGSLTPSERRIAEFAAAGQSNREIAQRLFVTPKTVEYHLRNTYRKLNIESRRQLATAFAI